MSGLLKPGSAVKTESSNLDCYIHDFLDSGNQGEVYRAELGGKPVAFKLYYPDYLRFDKDLPQRLRMLIREGAPNDRFLWPIEFVPVVSGIQSCGYIMPLREKRFASLVDVMKRRVTPTFRSLATAGFELANGYFQLHAKGLCYSNINFGNVCLDPSNGQVCICDFEYVHVQGDDYAVYGTMKFMAPEIVTGQAKPSIDTDLYSLAVLLFYMFMFHHPLDGLKEWNIRCFDAPAQSKLYGSEPVFIFDPKDASNRPAPEQDANAEIFWSLYPTFLKDLFTRAFTDGIRDIKNGRVRESEWRAAMIQLRDSIIYCHKCGRENFYHREENHKNVDSHGKCWRCGTALKSPFRIQIGRKLVMLNHDTHLYPYHIDDGHGPYDFSKPVSSVAQHPNEKNVWGLKNLTGNKWVYTDPDGSAHDIEPGRSVTLVAGRHINFGKIEGEIQV